VEIVDLTTPLFKDDPPQSPYGCACQIFLVILAIPAPLAPLATSRSLSPSTAVSGDRRSSIVLRISAHITVAVGTSELMARELT